MEVKRSIARYKPDISLGNILTIIGMGAAVVVWGLRLEGRVSSYEQISALQQQNVDLRFNHVESQLFQQKQETDGLVSEIKASLLRIEAKLDNKADKSR